MMKSLYKKYIAVIFFSLLLVVVTVIGSINLVNYISTQTSEQSELQSISEYYSEFVDDTNNSQSPFNDFFNGTIPDFPFNQRPRDKKAQSELEQGNQYFAVSIDSSGAITNTFRNNISNLNDDELTECVQKAIDSQKSEGQIGKFKFKIVSPKTVEMLVSFLDCSQKNEFQRSLLLISSLIGLISFAVIFLIAVMLSRKIILPLEDGMEKQKTFITDASHELKTPIAIISANTDVLALTGTDNQWVESIRKQTNRLNGLVQELVNMSRLDEGLSKSEFVDMDLSKLVCDAAEPFISLSEIENKKYTVNVAENISYCGNAAMLKKLVSILLDNAFKYSSDEANINLSLAKENKLIVLLIINKVDNPESINVNKIFDRFYRSDDSRSSTTGGTGIGLAMAKSIAEAHSAKISAKINENSEIIFRVGFKI